MYDYMDHFERALEFFNNESAKIKAKDPQLSTPDSKEAYALLCDAFAGICSDEEGKANLADAYFRTVEKQREGHPHDQLRAVFDRTLNKTREHADDPAAFDEALKTLAEWKAAHPNLGPLLEMRFELYKTDTEMRRNRSGGGLIALEKRIQAQVDADPMLHTEQGLGYRDLLDHLLVAKGEMMMNEGRLADADALFKLSTVKMRTWNDKKSLRRIKTDQKLLSSLLSERKLQHSATDAVP
jgi:hypothetical protein